MDKHEYKFRNQQGVEVKATREEIKAYLKSPDWSPVGATRAEMLKLVETSEPQRVTNPPWSEEIETENE